MNNPILEAAKMYEAEGDRAAESKNYIGAALKYMFAAGVLDCGDFMSANSDGDFGDKWILASTKAEYLLKVVEMLTMANRNSPQG